MLARRGASWTLEQSCCYALYIERGPRRTAQPQALQSWLQASKAYLLERIFCCSTTLVQREFLDSFSYTQLLLIHIRSYGMLNSSLANETGDSPRSHHFRSFVGGIVVICRHTVSCECLKSLDRVGTIRNMSNSPGASILQWPRISIDYHPVALS